MSSYIPTRMPRSGQPAATSVAPTHNNDTVRPITQLSIKPTESKSRIEIARYGLLPINVAAYLDNHIADNTCISRLAFAASWATLLNKGRKGDVNKFEAIGTKTFGNSDFIDKAIEIGAPEVKYEIARAGFAKIDVDAFMGDHSGENVGFKMLLGAMGALINLHRMGEANKVEGLAKWVFGEGEVQIWMEKMLGMFT